MSKEKTRTHESYGMLSMSRVTSNKGTVLFGSSLAHSNTIRLRIKRAEEKRHLNSFWYHGREELIEIEMSPTQFTDAITNMNTEGVPVTIRYVNGKEVEPPPYENIFDTFNEEFTDDISEILGDTCKIMKKVEEELKAPGTISKKKRLELAGLLFKVEQDIRANLPFVHKQFLRQVSKSISEAKGAIEAFFSNTIYRLGSEKMKKELEEGKIVPPKINIKQRKRIQR